MEEEKDEAGCTPEWGNQRTKEAAAEQNNSPLKATSNILILPFQDRMDLEATSVASMEILTTFPMQDDYIDFFTFNLFHSNDNSALDYF